MNVEHDSAEDQEFLAPSNGGWHYTTMRDWIAVCPDIGPTAIRLYWIIRSIMHEKGDKSRRLSIDHLCWLLPGVNGKPTSATRVKDALRELEQAGLLSNPDDAVTRQWVRDPRTGKQTKENFRRWQIHDHARPGYDGWRSAIAKLAAYPGVGWQDTEGRKTDPQSPESLPPAETPKPAGRTEGRNSAQPGRNSDQSRRKSGDSKAPTCGNGASKESSQGNLLTNQPPLIGDAGWMDEQPHPEPQAPTARTPGVRFLEALDVRHRPGQHATQRLVPLIEALLAGDWSWDDLMRAVTAGVDGATNPPGVVIHRIEKFTREATVEHLSRSELADRRKQSEAERAAEDRRRAEARALAIANCSMCDDIGYDSGRRLCDHNPAADEVHARGREQVQAVFAAKAARRVASPPAAS